MDTSYYSAQDLQKEAKRLAKQNHCSDCEKSMKLLNWEIAISPRGTTLVAQVACDAHNQVAYIRHMI